MEFYLITNGPAATKQNSRCFNSWNWHKERSMDMFLKMLSATKTRWSEAYSGSILNITGRTFFFIQMFEQQTRKRELHNWEQVIQYDSLHLSHPPARDGCQLDSCMYIFFLNSSINNTHIDYIHVLCNNNNETHPFIWQGTALFCP